MLRFQNAQKFIDYFQVCILFLYNYCPRENGLCLTYQKTGCTFAVVHQTRFFADMEFFIILPQAKIGNLPTSTNVWDFDSIYSQNSQF